VPTVTAGKAAVDAAGKGKPPVDAKAAAAAAAKAGAQAEALAPRLDFGSDEDFQLKQAINHLKGSPVIESVKALSAQAKPQ
jgi:hypothetical protein